MSPGYEGSGREQGACLSLPPPWVAGHGLNRQGLMPIEDQ